MLVLAIDPGPENSTFVLWDGTRILQRGLSVPNGPSIFSEWHAFAAYGCPPLMVIEKVEAMGKAVGAEVFETVFWSGRFAEFWERTCGGKVERIGRRDIKLHLCGTARAKDTNIRTALLDRLGLPGVKKNPGPTFGITSHLWAALAVAVYWTDTHPEA